jgi:hypothetical protein
MHEYWYQNLKATTGNLTCMSLQPDPLYVDGTSYSRWFADGTANDLSGKIAFTSSTSGTFVSNTGPFPNTAAVLNPGYVYNPAIVPGPNPVDIRERNITLAVWWKRECSQSPCPVEVVWRILFDFQTAQAPDCTSGAERLDLAAYGQIIWVNKPCVDIVRVEGSDSSYHVQNSVWMHVAVTVLNRGASSNDDFIMYINGVQYASASSNNAPTSMWAVLRKLYVGVNANFWMYDARFWYQAPLSATEVKRQMCHSGYYWEPNATVYGRCLACPAAKYSMLSGAASLSECQSCPAGLTTDWVAASNSSECVLVKLDASSQMNTRAYMPSGHA